MKHTRIKFVCTGMCGEDHPRNDHCPDCSHANFVTTVTTDDGKKVNVWFNMMSGASFEQPRKNGSILWAPFNPKENDPIWNVVDKLAAFADRNIKKWRGK